MTKISRRAMAARRGRLGGADPEHAGFTVIELVVLLLIIVVLVAVGIPTYLTLKHERSDPAAQGSLETALGLSNAFYRGNQLTYNGLCPSNRCGAAEKGAPIPDGYTAALINSGVPGPGGVRNPIPSTNSNTVSIDVVNGGEDIILAALADETGNCWAIVETQAPGFAVHTEPASFVGIFHAVEPQSKLHGKCYAGLFDTSKLIGSPPIIGPHGSKSEPTTWPAT